MRITGMLLAAPLMLLAGCAADPVVPDQGLLSRDAVVAPTAHKVSMIAEGTAGPIGMCAPGVVRVSVPGTGIATALGSFETEQTACLHLATGAMTDGVATDIAANGDKIYYTWSGQPQTADRTTSDYVYLITGGTGRFASAQGTMDVVVHQPAPGTWTATGTGWMSYTASDRADD